MKKLFVVMMVVFFTMGCTGSIKNMSQSYSENSQVLQEFAKITAEDWLFGSGIIQGALGKDLLPVWVFDELTKIDTWFRDHEELDNFQLGYIFGVRIRMASPIIKAAIEQYAPGLFYIQEVSAVLAFIGL